MKFNDPLNFIQGIPKNNAFQQRIVKYMFLFYKHNAYKHITGLFSERKTKHMLCDMYHEPKILASFQIL